MVFSSPLFLFWFLPLVLAAYYLAPVRLRQLVLTVFSYLFYGWGNPRFALLLLLSTAIDWIAGLVMARATPWSRGPLAALTKEAPRGRRERIALAASIGSNLALLGFFKYFGFALDSWNGLAQRLGLDPALAAATIEIALPLGISFYTFQSMSYTIDVYRGDARPLRSFVDFACFVSMFPQLVAGPILRFSDVADQLERRSHTLVKFARGIAFFAVGLGKKVLLANPCGRVADAVFEIDGASAGQAWEGIVAYAFQIYFDFSGYSDMAIGLGLMLGFVFARNFDAPYRAESISDFWRRWHISLSTWLRDYLYVPLGGNRKGVRRTYLNLAATMLIGGLWHGAAWNFVVWGGYHGALLALERAVGVERLYGWMPRALRMATTFALVLVGWVFFRAADLDAALGYLARMAGVGENGRGAPLLAGLVHTPYLTLSLTLAALVVWTAPQSWTWTREIGAGKLAAALVLFAAAVAALSTQDYNPFIYFIF